MEQRLRSERKHLTGDEEQITGLQLTLVSARSDEVREPLQVGSVDVQNLRLVPCGVTSLTVLLHPEGAHLSCRNLPDR